MKISIISTSHRKNSQSKRISNIFKNFVLEIYNSTECFNLDMFDSNIPAWTSEKKENGNFWEKEFKKISLELNSSDGFIFIVPEYGGMATPATNPSSENTQISLNPIPGCATGREKTTSGAITCHA